MLLHYITACCSIHVLHYSTHITLCTHGAPPPLPGRAGAHYCGLYFGLIIISVLTELNWLNSYFAFPFAWRRISPRSPSRKSLRSPALNSHQVTRSPALEGTCMIMLECYLLPSIHSLQLVGMLSYVLSPPSHGPPPDEIGLITPLRRRSAHGNHSLL